MGLVYEDVATESVTCSRKVGFGTSPLIVEPGPFTGSSRFEDGQSLTMEEG